MSGEVKGVVSIRLSKEGYRNLRLLAKLRGVSCGELVEKWVAARVELDEKLKLREVAAPVIPMVKPDGNGGFVPESSNTPGLNGVKG